MGPKVAELLGTTVSKGLYSESVTDDLAALGKYGIQKVYQVDNQTLNHFDAQLLYRLLLHRRLIRQVRT